MSILTEPKVYLMGQQVTDPAVIQEFLDDHEVGKWTTDSEVGGEKLVEVAGRVCYMSFAKPRPGGNQAYIHHILEVGHGSVLEHAVFSLLVTGVSRSLTHELVRHRAGFGYSQLSQRFVDESDCAFVEPKVIADDPELHAIWMEAVTAAQESYKKLSDGLAARMADIEDRTLRRKRAREAARSVLPNATETKIFVTGNARALRHFIEMRGDVAADAEIRRLAIAVLRVLQKASPNLFGDYEMVDQPDGVPAVRTPFKKV
ncbi:FAD-dependent thymidylate synthase [bacterium]|nr:FAD-dependent thymidylate synthase [bacterium]